jgi:predicted DNA-binding transcriptional regulator YafY
MHKGAELNVSARTVKRDLDALRAGGQVAFVGPARSRHYVLKNSGSSRDEGSLAAIPACGSVEPG